MELLTRSEELLLLTVWRLQGDAYGASIMEMLTKNTGREWAIGSVYGPLERLAKKGLLTSFIGAPTRERGGRSKRCYKLTRDGVNALSHTRQVIDTFWLDLPDLVIG